MVKRKSVAVKEEDLSYDDIIQMLLEKKDNAHVDEIYIKTGKKYESGDDAHRMLGLIQTYQGGADSKIYLEVTDLVELVGLLVYRLRSAKEEIVNLSQQHN